MTTFGLPWNEWRILNIWNVFKCFFSVTQLLFSNSDTDVQRWILPLYKISLFSYQKCFALVRGYLCSKESKMGYNTEKSLRTTIVSDEFLSQSCARAPPVGKFSSWRPQPWPTSPSSTAWPVRFSCSLMPFTSCCRPAETAREWTHPTPKTRYTSAFRYYFSKNILKKKNHQSVAEQQNVVMHRAALTEAGHVFKLNN